MKQKQSFGGWTINKTENSGKKISGNENQLCIWRSWPSIKPKQPWKQRNNQLFQGLTINKPKALVEKTTNQQQEKLLAAGLGQQ